jgi:hypothetical protein
MVLPISGSPLPTDPQNGLPAFAEALPVSRAFSWKILGNSIGKGAKTPRKCKQDAIGGRSRALFSG